MINSFASFKQTFLSPNFARLFAQTVSNQSINKKDSKNHTILSDLRQSAKSLANDFPIYGLKRFIEHWGDHIYNYGMKIVDSDEFKKFTSTIEKDIQDLEDKVRTWSNREIIHLNDKNTRNYYD